MECFEHPEKYVGRTMELAGDELTARETRNVWEKVTGMKIGKSKEEAPVFPPLAQDSIEVGDYIG